MGRQLSVEQLNLLPGIRLVRAYLVELELDDETVRYTDCGYDLEYGGHTWKGVGSMGGISDIDENEQLFASGVRVWLSGLLQGAVQIALAEQIRNRPLRVYLALMHPETYRIVGVPDLVAQARMDYMDIETD